MYRSTIPTLAMAAILLAVSPCTQVLAKQQQTPSQGHQIELVTGLNGASYEAYEPSVVKEVQQALKAKNLYQGEVNGVLDHATMEAIAQFQKKNGIVQNGIPTPETREALLGQE